MKKLIKKVSVVALCASLSVNPIVYAGVLDNITDEPAAEEINGTEKQTVETKLSSFSFPDTEKHWAKNWIDKAVKLGVKIIDESEFENIIRV